MCIRPLSALPPQHSIEALPQFTVPLGWLLGPYLDQYCYPRLLSLSSLDALLAWHPSPIGESG